MNTTYKFTGNKELIKLSDHLHQAFTKPQPSEINTCKHKNTFITVELTHEIVIKLTETAPVSTVTQHWSLETCQ